MHSRSQRDQSDTTHNAPLLVLMSHVHEAREIVLLPCTLCCEAKVHTKTQHLVSSMHRFALYFLSSPHPSTHQNARHTHPHTHTRVQRGSVVTAMVQSGREVRLMGDSTSHHTPHTCTYHTNRKEEQDTQSASTVRQAHPKADGCCGLWMWRTMRTYGRRADSCITPSPASATPDVSTSPTPKRSTRHGAADTEWRKSGGGRQLPHHVQNAPGTENT